MILACQEPFSTYFSAAHPKRGKNGYYLTPCQRACLIRTIGKQKAKKGKGEDDERGQLAMPSPGSDQTKGLRPSRRPDVALLVETSNAYARGLLRGI
jgi:hypothetical protein